LHRIGMIIIHVRNNIRLDQQQCLAGCYGNLIAVDPMNSTKAGNKVRALD